MKPDMSGTERSSRSGLTIPPPSTARPPLKVNVFQHMRIANTALCPLFPYLGEGCIAPATAVFRGGEGRNLGVFKHFNTEDEILTVWGCSGMRFKPGLTMADVKTHVVNIGFINPADPSSYACLCILQRQSETKSAQREVVTFICEKCNKPLLEIPFESFPADAKVQGGFYTPIGAGVAAAKFNREPESRTCKHCGHVSAPFPTHLWGWDQYGEQCDVVSQSVSGYPGALTARSSGAEAAHG